MLNSLLFNSGGNGGDGASGHDDGSGHDGGSGGGGGDRLPSRNLESGSHLVPSTPPSQPSQPFQSQSHQPQPLPSFRTVHPLPYDASCVLWFFFYAREGFFYGPEGFYGTLDGFVLLHLW